MYSEMVAYDDMFTRAQQRVYTRWITFWSRNNVFGQSADDDSEEEQSLKISNIKLIYINSLCSVLLTIFEFILNLSQIEN